MDVDWERLEAELAAGPSLADRIVATARRQRVCRTAAVTAVATVIGAASSAAGLVVALHGRSAGAPLGAAGRVALVRPSARSQAAIYVAALRGPVRARGEAQRVWVSSRICFAVPTMPTMANCADEPLPPSVRGAMVDAYGAKLMIAARPPVPQRPGDPPVVQFGPLTVRGNAAQLGVETRCGPGCGSGETLVLRRRGGRWQVAGSVGPRWVS